MAWHPTPNAWHGVHEMDGMHVLTGSVPGMRRPLTGCPYFYPWLHVTVLISTGKCTQPPCVLTPFSRHSLLQWEIGLSSSHCHPSFFLQLELSAGVPEGRPQDTRPGWEEGCKANENQRMSCTPSRMHSVHNRSSKLRRFLGDG